jgi:methionyl-tRNA formyltransferase
MATWPILNGETEAGVTLHLMDEGIDTGPIVDQRDFALPAHITARSLYEMFVDEAFELFKKNFLRLVYGDYQLAEQNHGEATYYSKESIDFAQDKKLELSQPASRIERTARAFYFPEYQLPTLENQPVRACHIVYERSSEQPPGTQICNTSIGGVYVAGDKRLVEFLWA